MKKYICIKKFGNVEIGEIFVESNKIHKKWKQKIYILENGNDDDWVLKSHILNKKYFKEIGKLLVKKRDWTVAERKLFVMSKVI